MDKQEFVRFSDTVIRTSTINAVSIWRNGEGKIDTIVFDIGDNSCGNSVKQDDASQKEAQEAFNLIADTLLGKFKE